MARKRKGRHSKGKRAVKRRKKSKKSKKSSKEKRLKVHVSAAKRANLRALRPEVNTAVVAYGGNSRILPPTKRVKMVWRGSAYNGNLIPAANGITTVFVAANGITNVDQSWTATEEVDGYAEAAALYQAYRVRSATIQWKIWPTSSIAGAQSAGGNFGLAVAQVAPNATTGATQRIMPHISYANFNKYIKEGNPYKRFSRGTLMTEGMGKPLSLSSTYVYKDYFDKAWRTLHAEKCTVSIAGNPSTLTADGDMGEYAVSPLQYFNITIVNENPAGGLDSTFILQATVVYDVELSIPVETSTGAA